MSKSDYVSVEARDTLEYAIIGYLVKKTDAVWGVVIEQEHMDFRVACWSGKTKFYTDYIHFEHSEIEKHGLLGVIFPYIDVMLALWERYKNES